MLDYLGEAVLPYQTANRRCANP